MRAERQSDYARYRSTHAPSFQTENESAFEARIHYFRRRLNCLLPTNKDALVLDLACGRGEFLALLRSLGYSSTFGVDISSEQVASARSRGLSNVVEAEMLEFLTSATVQYEFVLASHVLEHLEHDEVRRALALIRDRLTQRGRLVIITPNAGSPLGLPYAFGDFTHRTFFSALSLAQACRGAGLDIEDVTGVGPDPAGFRGRLRTLGWSIIKTMAMPLHGDRFMRYRILEPELLAIATVEKA